ncbi:MAG: hypothetical protein ACOC4Y_01325, partial [bacterium]
MQQLKLTVAGRYFKGAGGFPLVKGLQAGRKKLLQWQPQQPKYATCEVEMNDFKKFAFGQLNNFLVVNLIINNILTSFL